MKIPTFELRLTSRVHGIPINSLKNWPSTSQLESLKNEIKLIYNKMNRRYIKFIPVKMLPLYVGQFLRFKWSQRSLKNVPLIYRLHLALSIVILFAAFVIILLVISWLDSSKFRSYLLIIGFNSRKSFVIYLDLPCIVEHDSTYNQWKPILCKSGNIFTNLFALTSRISFGANRCKIICTSMHSQL